MLKISLPTTQSFFPLGQHEPMLFIIPAGGGYIRTSDGAKFTPELKSGRFDPGPTTTYRPAPDSENFDVVFCFSAQPVSGVCKDPISNPSNIAGHVIHIGSGGDKFLLKDIGPFTASVEAIAKKPAFAELWPSVKSFILLLLKAKPPISSRFRVVLQILAVTGDRVFLKLKEPK